ncbi:MAG: transglycosylase domain-containing protein [Thermodesulfobacteriota bacterium]
MFAKFRKLFAAIKPLLLALLILFALYLAVVACITVWAFEVALARWPVYVCTRPFVLRVGADVGAVQLKERLTRLGYASTADAVAEPGRWTESGLEFRVALRSCPLKEEGLATGLVSITVDLNRVSRIRLVKSGQDVDRISIEPEVLASLRDRGQTSEMCRRLPLAQIKPLLVDAILLTEDTRFHTHWGIDFTSIARAIETNLRERRYAQGGSTITQQLVRMTLLSPKKTLWRKANEMAFAVMADLIYSKERILEAYLNRVYFGQWGQFQVKGVAEASRLFFGKDTKELEPSECALLAAMIKAPNIINPLRHPQRTRTRRDIILGLMLKAGRISRDEYDVAVGRPTEMGRSGAAPVRASAYLELVDRQLTTAGKGTELHRGQVNVITGLDPMLQTEITEVVNRYSKNGACLMVVDSQAGDMIAYAVASPPEWTGGSGGPSVFAPLMMIPALTGEKHDPPRWTLASPVFIGEDSGGSLTFREAFHKRPADLADRVTETLGPERLIQVLGEFGVRSGIGKGGKIDCQSMPPLDVARTYLRLACLGKPVQIGAGIRINGASLAGRVEARQEGGVNQAAVFLVNHMLMHYRGGRSPSRKGVEEPSVFTTQDPGGFWAVAYHRERLVLLRGGGSQMKGPEASKIVEGLLPVLAPVSGKSQFIPEGVVFRKICLHSGLKATSLCPKVIREPFLKGTQPIEWCQIPHQAPKTQSTSVGGN